MEDIIGLALRESYHKRLAYLEGKRIITLNEYGKTNTISLSALLNKATRQTIEAFREKGIWKIGVYKEKRSVFLQIVLLGSDRWTGSERWIGIVLVLI